MSMFCYQCEQSAAPGGCTVQGVCGKTAPVANKQDELTAALVGLARALDVKGQTKEGVDYLMRGLIVRYAWYGCLCMACCTPWFP